MLVLKPKIEISMWSLIIIIIIIIIVIISISISISISIDAYVFELTNIFVCYIFLNVTSSCIFGLQSHSVSLLTESNTL